MMQDSSGIGHGGHDLASSDSGDITQHRYDWASSSVWCRIHEDAEAGSSALHRKIKHSLQVIRDAKRLFKDGLRLSYNGGKDATVLFHLTGAALLGDAMELSGSKCSEDKVEMPSLESCPFPVEGLTFVLPDGFEEETEFSRLQASQYRVKFESTEASFKEGLQLAVEKAGAAAFLMGTRRTDPHGSKLDSFSPSSVGWPAFFRVNPVLEWELQDIWQFLTSYKLAFCKLYNEGYASLGSKATTKRTAALVKDDGTFIPAYSMVLDDSIERSGRCADAKTPTSDSNEYGLLAPLGPSRMIKVNVEPIEADSASLVMVGRELLDGTLEDSNSLTLRLALKEMGVRVDRVVTVPGFLEAVQNEVRHSSKSSDVVIVVGGVGPGREDVSVAAVAAAHNEPLLDSPYFASLLNQVGAVQPDDDEGTVRKLQRLPASARLIWVGDDENFPLVQCKNVFLVPGVPSIVRQTARRMQIAFNNGQCPATICLGLKCSESVANLHITEAEKHRRVSSASSVVIWTRPEVTNSGQAMPDSTLVFLRGDDGSVVESFAQHLSGVLQSAGIQCLAL